MAAALRTISGLRASEYITESIQAPHAMFDYEINPDLTFQRGADVYLFTVSVFAQRTAERTSQVFLDELRDPNSTSGVKYTLEHDATLAAEIDYARVTRIGRIETKVVSAIEYLGCDFDVEVVI